MHYYATPNQPEIRDAMSAGRLRAIVTPRSGNAIPPGARWAADNGCYSAQTYLGDNRFLRWLRTHPAHDTCDFAVAPDVVGDAEATLARATRFLPRIRHLGYPVAFVAQDGQEHTMPNWDTFDVLFIGGTTRWKLGLAARALIRYAVAEGKPVHMGRVNSYRRLHYAHTLGVTSVDGTHLARRPHPAGLHEILDWLERTNP